MSKKGQLCLRDKSSSFTSVQIKTLFLDQKVPFIALQKKLFSVWNTIRILNTSSYLEGNRIVTNIS